MKKRKLDEKTNENAGEAQPEQTEDQSEAAQDAVLHPGKGKKVDGEKVLTKKQQQLRTIARWVIMTVGTVMMAASVYFFQTPNNFTLGGVAGISILLSNYLPVSQGLLMIIINVALLIIGLILLGKQCTIRTIYCSLMYSAEIWLFEEFDLIGIITDGGSVLTDETLLELVYAILLFGIGGALIFNCGSSSGGTDIIALILKKFTKINVGMALLIIDFVVVCISFFAFVSIETALFSLLGLFAKSFILDGVIESIGKTKYITIITTHPEVSAAFILQDINHGYTMYDAEGGYTGEKKKVLVTVCKRGEALKLKTKVKQSDPSAFVIITDANEILGKGFGGTI